MKKRNQKYVWIILVIFSTSFSPTTGEDGRNFLLIGLMIAGIPILLLTHFFYLIRMELLIYIMISYMLIVNILNFETAQFTSFAYTFLFIITFIYYTRLIRINTLPLEQYIKILRFLIYAYCITLLAQQFCSLTGLPIINEISSVEESFKFNTLASEPSHSARIMFLLMYSFICTKDVQQGKIYPLIKLWRHEKRVILAFLYPMLTMGSAGAFLLLVILSVKFMKWQNFLSVSIILIIGIYGSQFVEFEPIQRSTAFFKALLVLEQEKLIATDHSAALRILPGLVYLERLDLSDLSYWFGEGSGYTFSYLRGWIFGVSDEASGGGFFPAFFLDYGLISGFMFLSILHNFCLRKIISMDTLVCLTLIPSLAFNTQVFWLSLMLLTTNKHFHQQFLIYIDSHSKIIQSRTNLRNKTLV